MPKEPMPAQTAAANDQHARDPRDTPAAVPNGEPQQSGPTITSCEDRIRERARRMLDERGDAYSNHEEILIQASREIDNEDADEAGKRS